MARPGGSAEVNDTGDTVAVRLTDVSHRYGKTVALSDVNLDLPSGGTVALVGPDGVGKSTMMGLIAGVRKIQTGNVEVLDVDLVAVRDRGNFLSRVAYMPQGLGRNLYPTLSVKENIDFFGRLFGLGAKDRAAHIDRLVNATGLAPFVDRPAGKLSGGMKQKLGLCCALVHDPDLLILDEPTTGVDPLSRRQFWELVDSMRAEREGMTVLVSTAYMDEAERFEHLVAMDKGKVMAQGKTREIMEKTGAKTLEQAYISLLPEDERPADGEFKIPPWNDPGGEPAIEADNLVRRFGDFVAVDHVSFRIGKGEIFGFLGSNGSGKTTTMKMLTGLLDATEGTAKLFGRQVTAGDMETRMRVGYMSQAFSLYEELTVRQNLMLHAQLYQIASDKVAGVVEDAMKQFSLSANAEALPADLPLGIRQRLQLAAACLHGPEILILDEPTSGVDPAARDMFWRHLVRLSRDDGVTIFVSTHFMNEAERCDRISLMHRGKVLDVGTPAELKAKNNTDSLEDAFIAVLEKAEGVSESKPEAKTTTTVTEKSGQVESKGFRAWLAFLWAFARREAIELARDKLRLAFALAGPLALLCIAAYAISFDVQNLRLTILDRDQTHESRDLVRYFQGSRYFRELPPTTSAEQARASLRDGKAQVVIEVPPGFGRDLAAGRQPEVGVVIDGASTFTGSNARAYAEAILLGYVVDRLGGSQMGRVSAPVSMEPRFIYNQDFKSIYAMTPGVLMLCLILIPAMLTALGVVREKEIGSIVNFYASPANSAAFLIGKQAPYVVLAMVSFLSLVLVTVTVLAVPLKGSFIALAIGALLFVLAATGLGMMISTFVSSQVAAIFATALICLIPSVNFSGLLYPVSTLTGSGVVIARTFPASWFQTISLGTFTKGLGIDSFFTNYVVLGLIASVFILLACLTLKKQEA